MNLQQTAIEPSGFLTSAHHLIVLRAATAIHSLWIECHQLPQICLLRDSQHVWFVGAPAPRGIIDCVG